MTHTAVREPSRLVMARSRGGLTGPLLILLGIWGAVIPFVGHYFGYGFTPDNTWSWSAARGWLEVAPGAATFVGGAMIAGAGNRVTAMVGGWLAVAAGGWFVLGLVFSPLWTPGYIGTPSAPIGSATAVLERVGMFDGLGILIVLLAAVALGRASVVGVRDVAAGRSRLDDERPVAADTSVIQR